MAKQNPPKDFYDIDYYKSLKGEEAFTARLQGRLPILDINGQPFFVDIKLMQLQPKDNSFSLGINLNEGGEFDGIKKEYTYYYDPKTMSEAKVDPKTNQYPKGTLIIKFPDPYTLDPLAMARMNKKDDRSYLKQAPFLMYRVATVEPLKQVNKKERKFQFGKHGKGLRPQ